jgi:hypothetical protein
MKSPVNTIGYWSSVLALVFAIGYCIPQLLSSFNVLSHPSDLFWLFLPSLFLAPSFLVAVICLHYSIPPDERIWTTIGIAFAIVYCAFATLVYFTQLTVVIPDLLNSKIDETHVLAFKSRSFLMAVDCLGYFFMSLTTLFSAFAFRAEQKNFYRWMLANGLLVIIFIPAFFVPFFYYIGAIWMITFPVSMILAAKHFRKHQ